MTQRSSIEIKPTGGAKKEVPRNRIPVDTDRTTDVSFGERSAEENTPDGGVLELIPVGFLGC